MNSFTTYLMATVLTLIFSSTTAQDSGCWSWMIGNSGFDKVNAAATDTAGNIWIGGSYEGTVDFDPGPGVSDLTSTNFLESFLASYDKDGNFRFAYTMPGFQVADMDTDSAGNVYVCGYHNGVVDADTGPGTDTLLSYGQNDICVVSWGSEGDYRWGHGFGSPAGDEATSVKAGPNGQVILSGYFFLTCEFATSDTSLNRTAVGGTDAFVASLTDQGKLNWVSSVGGPGFDANAYAVPIEEGAFSNVGMIYSFTDSFQATVSGQPETYTSNGNEDVALLKYNDLGEIVWALIYGGPGSDIPADIGADPSGNLYQTGSFRDSMQVSNNGNPRTLRSRGMSDVFLIEHTPTGLFNAAASAGGPDIDSPTRLSIKLKQTPSIVLSGEFTDQADFDAEIDQLNDRVDSLEARTSAGFIDVFTATYNPQLTRMLKLSTYGGTEGDVAAKSYLTGAQQEFLLTIGRSAGQISLADSSCDFTIPHVPLGVFDTWVQKEQLGLGSTTSLRPALRPSLISVFPNPVKDYLHLRQVNAAPGRVDLYILNLQGQVVIRSTLDAHEEPAVDVSHLPAGLYLVKVLDAKYQSYAGRFLKK